MKKSRESNVLDKSVKLFKTIKNTLPIQNLEYLNG